MMKSSADPMQNLIHQQIADGSFKFAKIFQDICLGLTLDKIQAACPPKTALDIWITALAVALLTEKFRDGKDVWELVVDKAKNYLKKHVKDVNALLECASNTF